MKRIWKDGRFSWPFIAVVAYLAIAVFAIDFLWRVMKVPFAEFLATSAAVFAVPLVALVVTIWRVSRRQHSAPRG